MMKKSIHIFIGLLVISGVLNAAAVTIANDDYASTRTNASVNGNLLTNDNGDNLSIDTNPSTAPLHGTVTINSDGTFTYVPNTDYKGDDTFKYQVTGADGVTAEASVFISVDIDSALVAEYRFDECGLDGTAGDAIDNSVNRLHGTSQGTPNVKLDNVICSAVSFDGSSSVAVADNQKLNIQGSFSVSFWVYPTRANRDEYYVSKYDGSAGWDIWFNNRSAGDRIEFRVYLDRRRNVRISKPLTKWKNKWHFITAIYDANNGMSLYIKDTNYDLSNNNTRTGTVQTTTNTLLIGQRYDGKKGFKGSLDEVKIWDRPLTEQEVQDIYNNESAGRNWDNTDGTTTRVCRTCQCTAKPGSNLVSLQADFRTMTALGLPTDVNSILSPDFGSNYGASGDWYMAKRVYDVQPAPDGNNSASYQALSLSDNLEFGAAYWIRNTNASNSDVIYHANLKTVDFNATIADYPSCRSVNGKCVLIDLVSPNGTTNNGPYIYTMASFPVSKQIQWKEVRVLIDGVSYTPDQAEALGATFSATIWRYDQNGNSYTDVAPATPGVIDTIDPCYGYWVRLDQNASGKRVQLLVPEE